MNGLFTFNLGNGPCLRWKLVAAVKLQYGWPGFIPPYATRYLTKVVTISTTPTFGYGTPEQAPPRVGSSSYALDHFNNGGAGVIISGNGANADFPYGADLTPDPVHNESWEVTETHFKHIYNNGAQYTQTEVQLSNPYDLPSLEADADGFLAFPDVDEQPWNTWQTVGELISPIILNIVNAVLPVQVRNADQERFGPEIMDTLNSAAWYAYLPGPVGPAGWQPNGYMKCIGYVAMAGNYCQKTFIIDPAFKLLNESCQSGVGSCANEFKVTPPPLVPGQNAYVTITPNCQCGG